MHDNKIKGAIVKAMLVLLPPLPRVVTPASLPVLPLGGLMEQSNASLQRALQG